MPGYKRKASSSARPAKRFKKAYRRRRWTSKLAKRNISRIARQVVLSAAESKEKTTNHGKSELYHNSLSKVATINEANSTSMPMQGNGDTQRNGDRILARGFKVHCLCGQKADRPNVTWRVIVIAQQSGTSALTYNQLFKNVSGSGMLDEINDDKVTVLYHKYWKPLKSSIVTANAGVENSQEFTFAKRFFIPRKKLYKFAEDGSATHDDKILNLYMLPYDAFGTLLTDNISYAHVWTKFIFKDP